MRWHRSGTAGFREALGRAEVRGSTGAEKVSPVVGEILRSVREGGDAALAEYTRRFDRFDPGKKGFAVPSREIDAAWRRLPAALRRSLELAAERIEAAIAKVLDQGLRTADIKQDGCRTVGTREMGESIVAALDKPT